MVLAPPTPPPTSSTEIQDATRGSGSTSQATQEQQISGMAPDTYQLRFPSIVDAVMRSDYALVVDRADEIDLTVSQAFFWTREATRH